ncbi:MAG: 50S ribosomal protein L7/L12 [Candidatus Dependentiae bacterium]
MSEVNKNLIDQIGKLTVVELAGLVKSLEEEFGVSAAAPVAAAAAAPAAAEEAVEEKTDFKVTLEAAGDQKIKVIKALRSVTSLGLKEAKDLVDGAPAVVAESAPKEEADKMKAAIEEAGGTVKLS